ncbi:MAG: molybdopterin-guanine dinucleotide biosynthesis protein B, partial [Chloroflexi bacterium]|nr:molybdopterin-guanine dinucleotide biosynthesis protein B [Chloroflexota bacterium]
MASRRSTRTNCSRRTRAPRRRTSTSPRSPRSSSGGRRAVPHLPVVPVVRVQADERNAGKTLLASALIAELTRRGYRVGAVKHSHHPLPVDKDGSDTQRFALAGATRVVFAAADGVLERSRADVTLDEAVDALLPVVDIVIVEGFRTEPADARLHVDARTGTATLTASDGRELLAAGLDAAPRFADAIERAFELTSAGDAQLRDLLRRAAAQQGRRCPGVTLGTRMALAAVASLGLALPAARGRLDVTLETASCATDAIAAVLGCSLGRGTLRVAERGALAARVLDTRSG